MQPPACSSFGLRAIYKFGGFIYMNDFGKGCKGRSTHGWDSDHIGWKDFTDENTPKPVEGIFEMS